MNLSLAVFAFTSVCLSAYGEESAYTHERDAEAAMAESGGSPALNAMHPHDLQERSPSGLRKSKKDRGLQSIGDWEQCSSSSQCSNGCCSNVFSDDGAYKCTPLDGGFNPDICLTSDDSDDCWGDGTICLVGISCSSCCNGDSFWPDHRFTQACGQMPCWGGGTYCLAGTTCNSCCNGSYFDFWTLSAYCN